MTLPRGGFVTGNAMIRPAVASDAADLSELVTQPGYPGDFWRPA